MQGMLETNPDPISFNGVFTREVQWRGVLEDATPHPEGVLVRVKMTRNTVPAADGKRIPLEFVEFVCPRANPRCVGFEQENVGKEILFRTNLTTRDRDNTTLIRIEGSGSDRRVVIDAYGGSFLRVIDR